MKEFIRISSYKVDVILYHTSGLAIASLVSWSTTAMLTETSAADKLLGVAVISVTSFEASREEELAFYKIWGTCV